MVDVDLQRVHAELVAWGVLEPGAGATLTPRARAAFMRASIELRAEEERGMARPGNPMLLAAGLALSSLAPAGESTPHHQGYLAAVELASLPKGVRSMFGA